MAKIKNEKEEDENVDFDKLAEECNFDVEAIEKKVEEITAKTT